MISRQQRTIGPACRELAGQHGHDRIVAKHVVIDEVLIAEREPQNALADQGRDGMFGADRVPTVTEAGREPFDKPDRTIRFAEQQRSRIRRDRAAVETRHHGSSCDRCKGQRFHATLCRHRGSTLKRRKSLQHKNFASFRAPMHQAFVINPG